ncbi:MAG: hypothetical protein R3350_05095, partial [Saprospiraceae bacterium]|nr:hypothetical protein [Saprospiraceae bacterium]
LVNFRPLSDTTIQQTNYIEEWSEDVARFDISVPFNFTSGNMITRLNARAGYRSIWLHVDGNFDARENFRDTFAVNNVNRLRPLYKDILADDRLHALDFSLNFQSFRNLARQHINPRLGVNLGLRYRTTLGSEDVESGMWLGFGSLFLPGIGRDHSLYFDAMYQQEDLLDNYRFSDLFIYPRGYNDQIADRTIKFGINYSLPLAYPDWALGPVAFIKRIKTNLFFDYGRLQITDPFDSERDIRSFGAELTFDFRAFRLLEFDAGIRYSYLLDPEFGPDGGNHQFEFLLLSITQ